MQKAAESVDVKYKVVFITLLERNATQHAMTPGSMVKKHNGDVNAAKAEAKTESNNFIYDNLRQASGRDQAGDTTGALQAFGKAAHTIMDGTSPEHKGYQVYDTSAYVVGAGSTLVDPMYDFISFGLDMLTHKEGESRSPNSEEEATAIAGMRNAYALALGDQALKSAITPVPQPKPQPPPAPPR